MSNPESLDELCQILVLAMQSMKKANELPPYMTSKARDVNAGHIQTNLSNVVADEELFTRFINAPLKARLCSLENLKTKADLLAYIEEHQPYLDRIKSGSYKLILDRFMAAHELAIELSKALDTLLEKQPIKEKSLS